MTPAEYAALNGYQQQQQEESGGLLDFLGKAALAAGVAAGGYAGIRSLRGKGSQLLPKRQVARPQPQGFDAVRRIAAEGAQAKPLVTESALPPAPLTEVQRAAQGVELVRQARAERPQGIQLVNLPEARTVFDPWSGKQTIPDPFGAGTVPSPQITPRTTTTTQLLPAGRITTEELQAANRLLEDTDLLKRVEAEELAVENLLPENRAEQSRQQAQVRQAKSQLAGQVLSETKNQEPQISTQGFLQKQLEQAGYIETSVQKQQADLPIVADQSVNAVYSAEDQQTGRIKHRLQQNENLDLGQIELLEDMAEADRQEMMRRAEPSEMIGYEADAAINQVTDSLPDGRPVDQAEGINLTSQAFAQQAVAKQRFKSSSVREPLLDVEYKMYNLVAAAAEKGLKLEPNRALQILTNPNIELSFAEQNLFKVNPQLGKFALKGQTFNVGEEQTGASLGLLEEKLKTLPNVGEDPTSTITQAASGTQIRGRSRIPNIPEESRLRVSSSGRPLEADEVFIDEGGTLTVSPGDEQTEVVFPSSEPTYTRLVRTPETQRPPYFGPGFASAEQLKVGLKPEYAPKGMRAVETQEGKTYFIPISDPGGVGIYGEERRFASGPLVKFDEPEQGRVAGTYTKTAMRAPTEMPFKEKQPGGAGFSEMTTAQVENFVSKAPEGRVREAGLQELSRRQATKQSVEVSEALRRARIEGRDPQSVLRSLGFEV